MGKMFQIHEDDLSELEKQVASLVDDLMVLGNAGAKHRVKARQIKKILSDVRWNYGPPTNVEEVAE